MKLQKVLKIISIVSYLLIVLKGEIIGIPFIFWLLFNLFAFGNVDQPFAFLSAIGLIIIFFNFKKQKTAKLLLLDGLCFALLSSPIVARLIEVPVKLFDYGAFKMPLFVFVVCYVVSLVLTAIQVLRGYS